MPIPVLDQSAFGSTLARVDGFSSALMIAALNPPDSPTDMQCYVKAFPPGSRGVINEVTGWILAGTRRLAQPRRAWLLFLPWHILVSTWPDRDWGDPDPDGYPTFATLRLNSSVPKARLDIDNAGDMAELRGWPKLADKIAFDEWTGNADSNAGNLIRLAAGRFAGIDHGEICGGQYWQAGALPGDAHAASKLWHLLTRDCTDQQLARRIIKSAELHAPTLHGSLPALYEFWLQVLHDHEITDLVRWLNRRAGRGWMYERFAAT